MEAVRSYLCSLYKQSCYQRIQARMSSKSIASINSKIAAEKPQTIIAIIVPPILIPENLYVYGAIRDSSKIQLPPRVRD